MDEQFSLFDLQQYGATKVGAMAYETTTEFLSESLDSDSADLDESDVAAGEQDDQLQPDIADEDEDDDEIVIEQMLRLEALLQTLSVEEIATAFLEAINNEIEEFNEEWLMSGLQDMLNDDEIWAHVIATDSSLVGSWLIESADIRPALVIPGALSKSPSGGDAQPFPPTSTEPEQQAQASTELTPREQELATILLENHISDVSDILIKFLYRDGQHEALPLAFVLADIVLSNFDEQIYESLSQDGLLNDSELIKTLQRRSDVYLLVAFSLDKSHDDWIGYMHGKSDLTHQFYFDSDAIKEHAALFDIDLATKADWHRLTPLLTEHYEKLADELKVLFRDNTSDLEQLMLRTLLQGRAALDDKLTAYFDSWNRRLTY